MKKYRLAIMCAEKEPLDCHRTILVSRYLEKLGIDVQHIHPDGHLESHADAVERLMLQLKLWENDMFRSLDEIIEDAYKQQEARIAYALSDTAAKESQPARGAG
jgi:uncharacterized protein (DUF488 family)